MSLGLSLRAPSHTSGVSLSDADLSEHEDDEEKGRDPDAIEELEDGVLILGLASGDDGIVGGGILKGGGGGSARNTANINAVLRTLFSKYPIVINPAVKRFLKESILQVYKVASEPSAKPPSKWHTAYETVTNTYRQLELIRQWLSTTITARELPLFAAATIAIINLNVEELVPLPKDSDYLFSSVTLEASPSPRHFASVGSGLLSALKRQSSSTAVGAGLSALTGGGSGGGGGSGSRGSDGGSGDGSGGSSGGSGAIPRSPSLKEITVDFATGFGAADSATSPHHEKTSTLRKISELFKPGTASTVSQDTPLSPGDIGHVITIRFVSVFLYALWCYVFFALVFSFFLLYASI